MRKGLTIVLCLVLCVALLSCAKKKEEAPKEEVQQGEGTGDIVDILMSDGRYSTLVKAIEAAGLVETLRGEGPFTVFAPTDTAFTKLLPGTIEGLFGEVPELKNLLLYHVVSGKLMAADIAKLTQMGAMNGDPIAVMVMPGGTVMLNNDAAVELADIVAKNGIIHVVNKVIIPPSKTPPGEL